MPATDLALRLEQRYGRELGQMWRRTLTIVLAQYGAIDPDDVESSLRRFVPLAAEAIASGQRDAQQLARSFAVGYVEAEAGRAFIPAATGAGIAGTANDGASLRTAIGGAAAVVWQRLKEGAQVRDALTTGKAYVSRLTSSAVTGAAEREIEHQADRSRGLLKGWTWQVIGKACAACLAQQTGAVRSWSTRARRHAHCDCIRVPVVTGAGAGAARPTGAALFAAMSPDQQAALFKANGAEKAAAIRGGRATLRDFVELNPTKAGKVISEGSLGEQQSFGFFGQTARPMVANRFKYIDEALRPDNDPDLALAWESVVDIHRIISDDIAPGQPSAWTGVVARERSGSGTAEWDGSISFDLEAGLTNSQRAHLFIHESFHHFSTDALNQQAFLGNRGWEEGTAEQLTRIHRRTIFARMGISPVQAELRDWERQTGYSRFVTPLERIRRALGAKNAEFYDGLLRERVDRRVDHVLAQGRALEQAGTWTAAQLTAFEQIVRQADHELSA